MATATKSHTMSPKDDRDTNPQDFLDQLMRELHFGSPEGSSALKQPEASAPVMEGLKVLNHNKDAASPTLTGSTIELAETVQSPEMSVEPLNPRIPRTAGIQGAPQAQPEEMGWNKVVHRTRGVHKAKSHWMKRTDIKPRAKSLTGENGEPLTQEEYEVRRLDQRKRELVGRTIEGELIPREKGKGYFIKWNRWRHDRVFMSCAVVESVLGPRPKPGTMLRCTINRLGPDHVPWNRQNPVSNEIEHWYIRPSGFMYPQPGLAQQQSNQPWEYAGVHERMAQGAPPAYPGYGNGTPNLRGNGYPTPNRGPMVHTDARFSFQDRPMGRSRANSWLSLSRQGTDQSLLAPNSLVRMDSPPSPRRPISPRFARPSSGSTTGSTGGLPRSNTDKSQQSQRSNGSNGSQN